MALDAKAIKEEIPDKDTYDVNSRRTKGKFVFYKCFLNCTIRRFGRLQELRNKQ